MEWSLPSSTAAGTPIRQKCAAAWPEDFQMRAFCEKQQTEALAKLRARDIATADEQVIRRKCSRDWPTDFQMWNFCEEQQLKALGSIR